MRYVLARSRQGTEPVSNATSDPETLTDRDTAEEIFVYKPDESLIVRPGDEVLGSGRFELPPELVCVSPTGLGFLAAGVYGFNGGVAAELNIVDGSGKIVHRKDLEELFSKEEIEAFPAAMLSIAWVRGAWYNAVSREIVVVGRGPLLRVIAIDSGKVRHGGEGGIFRALSRGDQDARQTALELVAEMKMRSATGHVYRDVASEELMAIRGEAVPDALEEVERLIADPNQQVRRLAKQVQQTLRTKAPPRGR